jgi:hypothetical protein
MAVVHRSREMGGPALLDHVARVVGRQALRRSAELLEFWYSQVQVLGRQLVYGKPARIRNRTDLISV